MPIEKRGESFWTILDDEEALVIFNNSNIEMCKLYDDNSESVIQSKQDLQTALNENNLVGIYLGDVEEVKE